MAPKTITGKVKTTAPRPRTKKPAVAPVRVTAVKSGIKRPLKAKPKAPTAAIAPPEPVEPVGGSKQARLIAMLRVEPGATIDQMMALTGWQAHTVRGAISGVLRKRLGLNVACNAGVDGGTRTYRIVETRAAA